MSGAGDFRIDGRRLAWLAGLAVVIGALCAGIAVVLLRLIAFFTNLFYFQRLSFAPASPAAHTLGLFAIAVPVVGALIIGLIARYGSERIRGHGIPEALEAILYGQSRMQPRVAVLKPLSSAISIGSGGPFGAEGPIIMTGGAFGSLIAQAFHMTAAERKTLLVAGAAAGMSATFGTPVASVLLAVELLLFEWRPRSLIPVAIASATAALLRPIFLDGGALFPVPVHAATPAAGLLSAAVLGLTCGGLSALLTLLVYAVEDRFARLKLHWMWWPVLGAVVVGLGGVLEPRALGVGYDVIGDLLHGDLLVRAVLGLMIVKCVIWAVSLGSGTSGGVLAPLLIMGASLGSLEAAALPGGDRLLWPLVGIGAIMGGTMRAPFTGVLFALELTGDIGALPPLLVASIVAYGVTVLTMKRSILTEKIARRGYHLSREYSVDPLDRLLVRDVMTSEVVSVPAAASLAVILEDYFLGGRRHQGYPVVDAAGAVVGVITRSDILADWARAEEAPFPPIVAFDLVQRRPITIEPADTCRTAAEKMAETGVGRLVVLAPGGGVAGLVTRSDLLKARSRALDEEQRRERFFGN